MDTPVLSMRMAPHSNLPPFSQWARGQGVAVAWHLEARARFDVRPQHKVSRQLDARKSVEAAMLPRLQGNAVVADGANITLFRGGGRVETPLASKAPFGKHGERHKADVVTIVAPDHSLGMHVGNHDFFTFWRGMVCATCGRSVPIWCNKCLGCHACFYANLHPCTEVAFHIADDVCEDVENNSADEPVTPRKPDQRHDVAKMQAKLVVAAKNGKLGDWTKGTLSHCFDVLGVDLPSVSNRRQAREIAMQHALPLLAQWDAFVHETDHVTRSTVPPNNSQSCCSQGPVIGMDGLIDE